MNKKQMENQTRQTPQKPSQSKLFSISELKRLTQIEKGLGQAGKRLDGSDDPSPASGRGAANVEITLLDTTSKTRHHSRYYWRKKRIHSGYWRQNHEWQRHTRLSEETRTIGLQGVQRARQALKKAA